MLGQLAGGVGHELRNPLGVISNSVYYLKMVQPDANEKIKKHHAMIEQEVHNAAHIVSDLLDYAREHLHGPETGIRARTGGAYPQPLPGARLHKGEPQNPGRPATGLRRSAACGTGTRQPGHECLPGHD